MQTVGEVAASLLEALNAQLPASGFALEGIEVRLGAMLDLDGEALRAALCAMLPGVDVQLVPVDGLLRCKDCGAEYPADESPCPVCGSPHAELVAGGDLQIVRAWGSQLSGG
ncbi:MAG: hydrogenase/urease maturation nickel metallochaperone HypA [Myxococcota bacterium]